MQKDRNSNDRKGHIKGPDLFLMNSNEARKQGCLYGELRKDIKVDIALAQWGKSWKMAKTFSVCVTSKENFLIVSHET